VVIYTLPSRYCLPDMLGDEAWSRFGAMPAGYAQNSEQVAEYPGSFHSAYVTFIA
jgi:hypothetical protein